MRNACTHYCNQMNVVLYSLLILSDYLIKMSCITVQMTCDVPKDTHLIGQSRCGIVIQKDERTQCFHHLR